MSITPATRPASDAAPRGKSIRVETCPQGNKPNNIWFQAFQKHNIRRPLLAKDTKLAGLRLFVFFKIAVIAIQISGYAAMLLCF